MVVSSLFVKKGALRTDRGTAIHQWPLGKYPGGPYITKNQDTTVLFFKNWLSESNVKIDFPIYLGRFLLKIAFFRNVKIAFLIFIFFGGVNY